MVVKFIEDAENIELLITALRNFLQTIQYVCSLFFFQTFTMNKFGINNKP